MSDSENKTELIRKAFELKSQKKYKEAISMMQEALNINANTHENAEIYSQIGELYLNINESDLALKEFQKALSLDSSHKYSTQKCFDIYFEKGQYQKALYISQKICENEKNVFSYHNYLKTLCKLEKYQDVIEIFNSLDENIKLDPNILYLISIANKDKKEIILKRIIEIDDSYVPANLDLAKIAFEKNDLNTVINCCINLDDNIPEVSFYLGVIESKKKNYNKSINYFINAIKNDNNQNDYYFYLAKVYIDIAYYPEALECLNQSVKYSLIKNKKENLDEKYFLIGWILYKNKKYQNALLNLNLIDKSSKFYVNSNILIQAINLQENNFANTKKTLEELLKNQSDNSLLLDTLASVYKNLNMPQKAIEIYQKALNLHPDSLFYKMELADLYIDIDKYDKAMIQIDSIKEQTKNCANIYNSLARIYYRLKNYEAALENIEYYLKLDKNNAESYYFKGLILNDLNNFKEAKTYIYNAIAIKPDCPKYYAQMARSYFGTEEYEEALLYIKEAIELSPSDIRFKKMGYDIAMKIGNKEQITLYEKQLKRSENALRNMNI